MKDNMWEEANAILWKLTRDIWKKNLKTVIIKTQNQMGMLNIRLNNDEERIDKPEDRSELLKVDFKVKR